MRERGREREGGREGGREGERGRGCTIHDLDATEAATEVVKSHVPSLSSKPVEQDVQGFWRNVVICNTTVIYTCVYTLCVCVCVRACSPRLLTAEATSLFSKVPLLSVSNLKYIFFHVATMDRSFMNSS